MKGPRETYKEKKGERKKLPPGGGAAGRARQFQTERGTAKDEGETAAGSGSKKKASKK